MKAKVQRVLYGVFLTSCLLATVMFLLVLWGVVDPRGQGSYSYYQWLGTFAVVAVASAFTMSATRLVQGPPPEDDRG